MSFAETGTKRAEGGDLSVLCAFLRPFLFFFAIYRLRDRGRRRLLHLLLNRTFLVCRPLGYLGWGRQLRYIPTAAEGFNQRYGAGHL